MSSDRPTPRALAEALASCGVDGVALTWVDNSGIARVKTVPTAKLEHACTAGVGMSPVFDVFLLDDSITASASSTGPVGDLRLYPDLGRLVELAAQPGWAWAPVDRRAQTGEPHPLCSRSFAARMAERAMHAGIRMTAAFEVEWALDAGQGDELTPATDGPAYGTGRLVDCSDYARDVLRSLAQQSVAVEQLHPEYAAGQFEISVEPGDAVGAADDSVLVRQTLRAVGRRHGYRTSFSPSFVAGEVGNGGHVHLSLWREGRNLFAGGDGPHGISGEAESFSAGILRELPALLAVGAPSVASYQRLVPHRWAGAFRTWGLENREAALRLVKGMAGHEATAANLEVKCFDLTANPYLVTGALLAAGLRGMEEALRLPPEITVDPGDLSEQELATAGAERLPTDLPSALARFEMSTVLAGALGAPLHETVAAVRRAEVALFADATPVEIASRTRWRH